MGKLPLSFTSAYGRARFRLQRPWDSTWRSILDGLVLPAHTPKTFFAFHIFQPTEDAVA